MLEPGVAAQGNVHNYRLGRAAADNPGGPLDHVGRSDDAGEVDLGELDVQFGRLERFRRAHLQADEGSRVVFLPQFDPARVSQANGSEDRGRQIPGPHHPPAYKNLRL